MSTKVYYGFRMVSKKLPEVLQQLGRASKEFAAIMQEKQDRFIATLAVELIDKHQAGISVLADGEKTLYPRIAAERCLLDRQGDVRKSRYRDPAVDTEVIFKLWHHPKEDTFVGVLYAEDAKTLHERLLGMGIAKNFAYWNNTDKPDNLSDRVWKYREKVWDDCFHDRCGPSFRVDVPEIYTSRGAALLAYVPSYETRITALAVEAAFKKYTRPTESSTPSASMSEIWKKYLEFNRDRQDPASPASALVDVEVARLKELLFLGITAEVLSKFNPPEHPLPLPENHDRG